MVGMVWTEPLYRLPRPTGPHAVGRTARDWTDVRRTDPYGRRRHLRRLAVWIWYPAAENHARPAPYLPGLWRATGVAMGIQAGRVRTHSVRDAEPAPSTEPWPVVVFSPSANPPLLYSALLEELASHGFVVAGISHTYEPLPVSVFAGGGVRLMRGAAVGGAFSAPGSRPFERDLRERSRLVSVKADDIRFVLDTLRGSAPPAVLGRLDLDRAAAVGHSFGGSAAAAVCHSDPPVRAGAALDAGLWREPDLAGVETPFLQVFGAHPEYSLPCEEAVRRKLVSDLAYCAADRATTVGAWQALHDSARPGYSVQVRGAAHGTFLDAPLLPLYRWSALRRLATPDATGPAGPAAWRAAADLLLAFLDRHLRASRAPLLDRLAGDDRFVEAPPADLFASR
jgi:hypothetical protein